MEILNTLQPKLNIHDERMPEYEIVIKEVNGILDEHKIIFNENSEMAFYAHIINYIRRLKDQEYLNLEYEELRKEIDEDIYGMAEEIVELILAYLHQ